MTVLILDTKLDRLRECAAQARTSELFRNLLHAYTACLSIEELCEAVIRTLDAPAELRGAVRNRLARIGREGAEISNLDELVSRLLSLSPADAKVRQRVDALLSHLYAFLSPPIRQVVLERWRDRGTLSAGARWLKAIADDELMFSGQAVLDYWRASGDWRAAKLLAYRAEPTLVAEILPELLRGCEEGWIISRAVLRASPVPEEIWASIRADFPATYAYLCAKTGRVVGEAEALALVLEADAGPFGDRGLAIWAVGQMGLWSVLNQIQAEAPNLRDRDLASLNLDSYTL